MGKIQILDRQVADLIAAGEVVERPASVVKELVENAVDAGATSITVEIKKGGASFIRVADNGSGILREDAQTAFIRHATSKIATARDLEAITTLGFRGEALAAIAAVSRLELITRTQNEESGTHILLEGGELVQQEDIGCPVGTTMIVRDLFFNTPARLKFLKKDMTETGAISSIVENLALAVPGLSVRFIKDGREGLFTPGDNKLSSVIYQVFGRELSKEMLPVSYSYEGITVNGFVTSPAACRPNRSRQHFFVNGRSIRSRILSFALEEAYKSRISPERYPAAALKIELKADLVDANVHPSKIEVKFANERTVYDGLYFAVQNALLSQERLSELKLPAPPHRKPPAGIALFQQEPEVKPVQTFLTGAVEAFKEDRPAGKENQPSYQDRLDANNPGPTKGLDPIGTPAKPFDMIFCSSKDGALEPYVSLPLQTVAEKEEVKDSGCDLARISETALGPALDIEKKETVKEIAFETSSNLISPDWRIVGEAFGTYILIEKDDQLLLMDKHAAHERILYEGLRENRKPGEGQVLLAPVAVTLAPQEAAAVLSQKKRFEEMGFSIEEFGQETVLIREVPLELSGCDPAELICAMAGEMIAGVREPMSKLWDRALYTAACKAAVKGNSAGKPLELSRLAEQVFALPSLKYCPHGRPITMTLSRYSIEKQFKRV